VTVLAEPAVFWAQGFGAWGHFNGDGNAASVRRDLSGFFTGLDMRVGESGRAGIAAGYTGSRNNLDGRGSANSSTADAPRRGLVAVSLAAPALTASFIPDTGSLR
jgi:outer membrane autotransporter protein